MVTIPSRGDERAGGGGAEEEEADKAGGAGVEGEEFPPLSLRLCIAFVFFSGAFRAGFVVFCPSCCIWGFCLGFCVGWQYFFGGERESETGLSQPDGRIPHSLWKLPGGGTGYGTKRAVEKPGRKQLDNVLDYTHSLCLDITTSQL